MRNRLGKFLRLQGAERCLVAKAALWLWAIRIGLWVLPLRAIWNPAEERAGVSSRKSRAESPPPDRIAWAVAAASRYVPRATCLVQALALRLLLVRYGHTGSLRIGVARGEEGRLCAHAWVEGAGGVLIGGSVLGRYTPLPSPDEGRR